MGSVYLGDVEMVKMVFGGCIARSQSRAKGSSPDLGKWGRRSRVR